MQTLCKNHRNIKTGGSTIYNKEAGQPIGLTCRYICIYAGCERQTFTGVSISRLDILYVSFFISSLVLYNVHI